MSEETSPDVLLCQHSWRPWRNAGGFGFRPRGSSQFGGRSFDRRCRDCGLGQSLNTAAGSQPVAESRCPVCSWPRAHPARSFGWPARVNPCGHGQFDSEFQHAAEVCNLAVTCKECDAVHHWPLRRPAAAEGAE